jgi:hypothetical protein
VDVLVRYCSCAAADNSIQLCPLPFLLLPQHCLPLRHRNRCHVLCLYIPAALLIHLLA